MGKYGYGPGEGYSRYSDRRPRSQEAALPWQQQDQTPWWQTGGGGRRQQWQPRGFPEAVNVEQAIPDFLTPEAIEGVAGLVDTAFRAPAYTFERPIAALDVLTGQPQGESALDPVAEGLRGIPFLGEHLDNAGKLAENIFDFTYSAGNMVAQPVNAHLAALWDTTRDNDEGDALGLWEEFQAVLSGTGDLFKFLSPDDAVTKHDLRLAMQERGYTNQDLAQIHSGEKGWLDFADKDIRLLKALPGELAGAENMLWRIVGDPLNFLFFGNVVGKTGQMFRLGKAVGQGAIGGKTAAAMAAPIKLGRIRRSSTTAMARLLRSRGLSPRDAAIAVGHGQIKGVGRAGMSGYILNQFGRFGRSYRNLAIGATALQMGTNVADAVLPQDAEWRDGMLGDLFQAARQWGERKPLSHNDLFALTSIFHFPARSIVRNTFDHTVGRAVKAGRRPTHELVFLKKLDIDVGKGDRGLEAARSQAHQRFGGEESYKAALYQTLKVAVFYRDFLSRVSSLPPTIAADTLAEAGYHANELNGILQRQILKYLDEGVLNERDISRAMDMMHARRGGVTPREARGVQEQVFDPDAFVEIWKGWEPIAQHISAVSEHGVAIAPSIVSDMVTVSDMKWVKEAVRVLAGDSDVIAARELLRILRTTPAVYHFPEAQRLQKLLTREGREAVPKREVSRILSEIEAKHAIPDADFFAPMDEWERAALGAESTRHGGNLALDEGRLADDIHPDQGNIHAEFGVSTLKNTVAHRVPEAGHVATTRLLRSQREVLHLRESIPFAMGAVGIGVRSAVDGVTFVGSRNARYAVPTLKMRLDSRRPLGDALESVALGLERTGAPIGRVVLRGDDVLKRSGVGANAVEYSWQAGRMTDNEVEALIRGLQDDLADFTPRLDFNDATGLVRVTLPDGTKGAASALRRVDKRLGQHSRDRVHIIDVVRGKAKHGYERSYDDVLAAARRNKRYWAAREYVDVGPGSTRLDQGGRFAERARGQARGEYPDRAAGAHDQPTRWEADQGTGVLGVTEKHRVDLSDARTKRSYSQRLREAGVTDSPGSGSFFFRPGDKLFAARNSGAVVRESGELIPWFRADRLGRRLPDHDEFGAVLAEASGHATWIRVRDADAGARGITAVDRLGDHGWVVATRGRVAGEPDVLYLVRDPDDFLGLRVGKDAWLDSRAGHGSLVLREPQQARAQAMAYASQLHPQQVSRLARAAEDAKLLSRQRRIEAIDAEMSSLQDKLQRPMQSSTYRQLIKERERLVEQTSTTAGRARHDAITRRTISPGRLTYVRSTEDDLFGLKPMMDESISGNLDTLPPGQAQKLVALERDIRAHGSYVNEAGELVDATRYTLKVTPRGATPYYIGQNEAYDAIMKGRRAATNSWYTRQASRFGRAKDLLVGERWSRELADQTRQEMYNELINKGATAEQVNGFLALLKQQVEVGPSVAGVRVFKSVEDLLPRTIEKAARGELQSKIFNGFDAQTIEAVGNFADVVQRAGSRTFRNLAKRYPATDGRGHLGKLIETWYGKRGGRGAGLARKGRRLAYAAGVGYYTLRFLTDPRWYLMNWFEADILGMARYGTQVRGILGGGARTKGGTLAQKDAAIERLAGRSGSNQLLSIEETLQYDAMASGWMDQRNLYGYVSEAGKVERGRITQGFLEDLVQEGSPIIDDLTARFGGDARAWVDEIDDMLYAVDTKGARAAVMENALAKQMRAAKNPAYDEFLEGLWRAHRDNFKDIVHTFHGNVNRSNIERLINSPFLWWPASYQLKAGKWLIDLMTKSYLGRRTELAGTALLAKLLSNHKWAMENDDDYRGTFEDHPALWRTLGMLLPMTPFDMGAYMARWTRYSGSWIGAQLGLWDEDPSYPQDPWNFVTRSLALGPVFSADLVDDIFREFE